ncbi:MAG: hypothetical protein AAF485_20120, partial [Chloroflexota bacterium]
HPNLDLLQPGKICLDDQGEVADVIAACVLPNATITKMPTGAGTLSVAAYSIKTGRLKIGQTVRVTSPPNQTLSRCIYETSAHLEGTASIIALTELGRVDIWCNKLAP